MSKTITPQDTARDLAESFRQIADEAEVPRPDFHFIISQANEGAANATKLARQIEEKDYDD